jgi:hypothetical protein
MVPAPIGTFTSGTSPVGPAFHSAWDDPLGTPAGWPWTETAYHPGGMMPRPGTAA